MATMTVASSLVPALPGVYYTTPAAFDAEKRRIFERSWMCVGRADAVRQQGRFLCTGSATRASFAGHVEGFSLSGQTPRPRLPGLLPQNDRLFHAIVLRPNALIILDPDHVAIFRLEPREAGHTRVVVDWLFDRETMAARDFDLVAGPQWLQFLELPALMRDPSTAGADEQRERHPTVR